MTLVMGAYLFTLALVLAHLEIQIEGAHGWAAKLPTWRWESPAVMKWAGKPITGYHVYLLAFILLFIHFPAVYLGFSWERESELMAMFFLLAVVWDFLWFVCNPHFGLSRFRAGQVWWFKAWWLGVPLPYYQGIALSFIVYMAPAVANSAWRERSARWSMVVGELAALTLAVAITMWLAGRRQAASAALVREQS